MNKHNKGPWRIVEGRTQGSIEVFSGETAIAEMWRRGNASLEMANSRRIVACINACEGFSIEELEGADLFKDSIESDAEIIALKKQRDGLLEALKGMVALYDTDEGCRSLPEYQAARAAIAKAGGNIPPDCYRQRDELAEENVSQGQVYWEVLNGVCSYGFYGTKDEAEKVCFDMQKSHDLSGSLAAFNVRPRYTKAVGES